MNTNKAIEREATSVDTVTKNRDAREHAIRALGITPLPSGYVVVELDVLAPDPLEEISAYAGDQTGIWLFDKREDAIRTAHYMNMTWHYKPYYTDIEVCCMSAAEYTGDESFVPAPQELFDIMRRYFADDDKEEQYVSRLLEWSAEYRAQKTAGATAQGVEHGREEA